MIRTIPRAAILILILLLASTGQARAASVTIAWDPNPESNVRYVVYWGTQHSVYPNSASSGTATSYVVANLTPGQTYYFAVQATTVDGLVSPFSEEVSTRIAVTPTALSGTSEPDPNWRIVARADFDGDGKADIAWRNGSTGETRVWFLNGDTFVRSSAVSVNLDTNWDIVAAADFNRDGKPDLVARNRVTGANLICYMDGSTFVRSEYLRSLSDAAWTIAAAADFNGDGYPDLLWRHAVTGENAIWYMDGTVTFQQSVVLRVADLNWRIAAVDDFNRDGYPDIVWWYATSGQTVLWEMRGGIELAHSTIDAVTDTNVRPVASGDFDGDGRPELVWRDVVRGRNEIRKVSAAAQVTSPNPGSTIGTSSVTFGWSRGSGVSQVTLYAGTGGPGSYDIYYASQGTNLSRTISGLPLDGSPVYVRLWSLFDTGWRYLDYTFKTTGSPAVAQLTSPAAGTALTSSSATFAWTPGNGVSKVALYVGTAGVGSYNVYYGNQSTDAKTVTGLPTTGAPIFVRLWSLLRSGWQYVDYTYNADPAATAVAEMTSPIAGSTLTSSSVTFQWTPGTNVSQTVLYVGTGGSGSYDLYYGSQGTALSRTVAGLPVDGSTIYVRLWSRLADRWQYVDYTYKAGKP